MSENTSLSDDGSKKSSERNHNVVVRRNDMSIFDGAFTFMKQRFGEEMRRIDEEMTKFSKTLSNIYQTSVYNNTTLGVQNLGTTSKYDSLTGSPLIEDVGDDKLLRLQFDVSQFEPEEVTVEIKDTMLIVTAQHEEKSEDSSLFSKYRREFRLPNGIDPASVDSQLSKDGVLVVTAPLNLAIKDDI